MLIVCAVPVLKLVLMAVLFKVTAAVIEPVADKRVVKAVNALGTAVGMLLMTVLAAVSLFLLMLAMIVMMTGLQ
ncbi:MAG: stage III sporulation protein AE [Lachnospira sp.]